MGCPYAVIRFDTENEEPVRDSRGFCLEVPKGERISCRIMAPAPAASCKHHLLTLSGETGLLVSKIAERTPFFGYANNKQQTEKKKLYDVFVKGDKYFNTGDLMKIDHEGFVYFQDRIGDTFRYVNSLKDSFCVQSWLLHVGCCVKIRWKGENVATTEVADNLLMVDCIEEANVYGVKVPGKMFLGVHQIFNAHQRNK